MRDRTVDSNKLPRRIKLIYGLGDWGTSSATAARTAFWFIFLTNVVGLDPALAGTVFLVGTAWDGINDPLIGTISDRLQSRWGRRRPFLLFGAIPFGLAFFLMFIVPAINNPIGLVIYYAVVFLIFDTCYTIVNVPYSALMAELSEDYDERSNLAGWRMSVAIFGMLVTAGAFKLLAENVFANWFGGGPDGIRIGYALAAGLWSISFMIPLILLGTTLREPRRPPDRDPVSYLQTFREVFRNRPFRLAALIYLLTFATSDVILVVFVRFLIDYVQVVPGYDNLLLALVLTIALLTMPLVVKMMHYFGKRTTYILNMSFLAIVLVIMSQVKPGDQQLVTVAAIFAGLGFGAANAIPWAIVADVVEADELATGKRREGVYFGYLVFFRKLMSAVSIFIVGQVLSRTGYISSTTGSAFIEQPESALLAMRFFVGFFPAIMLLLAMFVAWRYPLDRRAHDEIRRQLAERRATAVEVSD